MTYISANSHKAFRYDAVQAFDYYPQVIDDKRVETLRVLLLGGDQWFEGPEATALYQDLLNRAKMGGLGT